MERFEELCDRHGCLMGIVLFVLASIIVGMVFGFILWIEFS